MKSSSKMDPKAIQQLLVAHFEKGLLGIIVIVFLVMACFAVSRIATPKFTTTPTELDDAAKRAEQHIKQTPGNIFDNDLKHPDYAAVAKKGWQPDLKLYSHAQMWNPPLFPERRKRTDPPPFPLQDLHASADQGSVLMAGAENRGPEPRGLRWVVLTALIPYEDQMAAYREAFKDNSRPTDVVEYRGVKVERTEIGDRGEEVKKVEVSFGGPRVQEFRNRWPATATEIAPPNVVDPMLTSVLPPLSHRSWGEHVVHPPEITPVTTTTQTSAPKPTPEKPAPATGPKNEDVFGAFEAKPNEPAHTAAATTPTAEATAASEPKYKLFRYFDDSVVPGKQYRYRVQLVLANPNRKELKIDPSLLANPASAEKPLLVSEWSEASDVVGVPLDDRLFAMEVKQRQPNLGMVKWLEATGLNAITETTAEPGQLTNYKKAVKAAAAAPEEQPVASPAEDLGLLAEPGKPAKKEKKVIRKSPTTEGPIVDFASNFVLLDTRGGERLAGRDRSANEPAEYILLAPNGRLIFREELIDAPEYQKLKESSARPAAASSGMGGGDVVSPEP
jgi:hypothetical protein